jgi:hypothetical protein
MIFYITGEIFELVLVINVTVFLLSLKWEKGKMRCSEQQTPRNELLQHHARGQRRWQKKKGVPIANRCDISNENETRKEAG